MSAFLVRPPVAELVFQLFGKPLHPELFDILAARRLEREDYQLRIWITRTGHVISFENEDVLLTEVADADQAFSPSAASCATPCAANIPAISSAATASSIKRASRSKRCRRKSICTCTMRFSPTAQARHPAQLPAKPPPGHRATGLRGRRDAAALPDALDVPHVPGRKHDHQIANADREKVERFRLPCFALRAHEVRHRPN